MRPGSLIDGKYRVVARAGSGGMGVVWEAFTASEERVAVKTLAHNPSDAEMQVRRARFEREADALSRLDHPGIVHYLDHGTWMDRPYLVMEWIEGVTLASLLAQRTLGLTEAVVLGRQVAEALGAAHAQGIVHRDLKPSNLILDHGSIERVKLTDFGVALLTHHTQRLTRSGVIVGTCAFMSPEQARGDEVDARADLFSLGVLLHACITGGSPFAMSSIPSTILKLLLSDAPLLRGLRPDTPVELEALVARLLERDPARRPASAVEVGAALGSLRIDADDGSRPRPDPLAGDLSTATAPSGRPK